jgi:CDP-diacylglycerol---serine O-phosphatidyltransferase
MPQRWDDQDDEHGLAEPDASPGADPAGISGESFVGDPGAGSGGDSGGGGGRSPRSVARRGIAVLPTMFTLANLLCGFGSIFFASRPTPPLDNPLPFGWSPLTMAAAFVFLGLAMDGLDGRVAKLTRSVSDLGAQLDSMADMVTFGVAPAFMVVQLIGVRAPFVSELRPDGNILFDRLAIVVACIYVACVALRLARYNIESTPAGEADRGLFKGLPSPGAAGTVASLILLHQSFLAQEDQDHLLIRTAAVVMVFISLLTALAMVSQFRYVHLMNRYVRGRAPFGTVAKAVIIGLLLVVWLQGTLAAAFVIYSLSAPSIWAYRRVTRSRLARHASAPGADREAGGVD